MVWASLSGGQRGTAGLGMGQRGWTLRGVMCNGANRRRQGYHKSQRGKENGTSWCQRLAACVAVPRTVQFLPSRRRQGYYKSQRGKENGTSWCQRLAACVGVPRTVQFLPR
ncbi:hypothetical protein ISCGN_018648 [Ixodes scapularis]